MFIKLTAYRNEQPIHIQASSIVSFQARYKGTEVHLNNRRILLVKETPDQVVHLQQVASGKAKAPYAVVNGEGEIFLKESLIGALQEYRAERDSYSEFTGDEVVYLFQTVRVSRVAEDKERMKHEDPREAGYEAWARWEEEIY